MRAAADRNDVSVALKQMYALDRRAEPFRHALREARLVALPARQSAHRNVDAALRLHRYPRIFAREATGRLDVVGKPDTAQPAAALGIAAALAESLPVGERQRALHRAPV